MKRTLFLGSILSAALCSSAFAAVTYQGHMSEIVTATTVTLDGNKPYRTGTNGPLNYTGISQDLADWSIDFSLDFYTADATPQHKTPKGTGSIIATATTGGSSTGSFTVNVNKVNNEYKASLSFGDRFNNDAYVSIPRVDGEENKMTLSYCAATDKLTLSSGSESVEYSRSAHPELLHMLKNGNCRVLTQGGALAVKVLGVSGRYYTDNLTGAVTFADGTTKTYGENTVQFFTSARTPAYHSDPGAKAYIVDEGAQLWFAATDSGDAANVQIVGDLYLQSTGAYANDNRGALRLDTANNHKVTLNGAVYLGQDSTITSHKNDADNAGDVVFANTVTGDYVLTLNHRSGHTDGSFVTFEKAVDIKGLTVDTSSSFEELNATSNITVNGNAVTVKQLKTAEVRVNNTASLTVNNLLVENTTTLAVADGATLNIHALTMGAGARLTFGTEQSHDNDLTTSGLMVNGDSTLNANLVMTEGTMSFAHEAQLTMGCSVVIGEEVKVVLTDADIAMIQSGHTVDLILSAEQMTLGNGVSELSNIYRQDSEGNLIKLSSDFKIVADDVNHKIYAMPEPATATLSLLALAGLAARRRRK